MKEHEFKRTTKKKGEMGIIGFRGKGQRYVEFPILTISSFKILKISAGDVMVTFISKLGNHTTTTHGEIKK